jgi:hypothetical protein
VVALAQGWRGGVTDPLDKLFGCGDLDALFGGQPRVLAPWPRGPRRKHEPAIDVGAVEELLARPVELIDADPRELCASQRWVVRHHAGYYLTGEWERTGRTSADVFVELNQFPVVVDRHGRLVIVSGHHRTAAALVEGRPLRVRVAASGERFAVTSLLFVDPNSAVDTESACASIVAGEVAAVATAADAGAVLRSLAVPDDEVRWRLTAAGRRRSRATGE